MRRRSKPGREPAKARRRKTVTPKRRNAPKVTRSRPSSVGGKDKKIALLTHERDEALARQIATADILRIISQSPTDVRPVFDSIVLTAARLLRCDLVFVLALRRRYLFARGRGLAGGPARGPRAHEFADRSQRQLSLACDPRQKNAAPAGLVAHRSARARAQHP